MCAGICRTGGVGRVHAAPGRRGVRVRARKPGHGCEPSAASSVTRVPGTGFASKTRQHCQLPSPHPPVHGFEHARTDSAGNTSVDSRRRRGVGLAGIQIAQRRGSRVLATAGSRSNGSARRGAHVRFAVARIVDQVLAVTGGLGVDVVLNSLAASSFPPACARSRCERTVPRTGEARYPDAGTGEGRHRLTCAYHRAYDLGAEADADRSLVGRLLDVCTGSGRRVPSSSRRTQVVE